ncbi:MAG: hypothetical protein ACI81T_000634, partial [Bacteroidia bacterium]
MRLQLNIKNMKSIFSFIILAGFLSLASCNKEGMKTKNSVPESQGMKGTVVWLEGNMMPSYGEKKKAVENKGKPVVREIYFCKPTKMNELENDGTIFQGVEERMFRFVSSDKSGKFSVNLAAGKYSVFTKEKTGFFANSFDG